MSKIIYIDFYVIEYVSMLDPSTIHTVVSWGRDEDEAIAHFEVKYDHHGPFVEDGIYAFKLEEYAGD